MLAVARVVEGLDCNIRVLEDGCEIVSEISEESFLDGGAALVCRLKARSFEALGRAGRLQIFRTSCIPNQDADLYSVASEELFSSLVGRLDQFLTRLDMLPAGAEPPCAKNVLAMFDPSRDDPWASSYPIKVTMQGSDSQRLSAASLTSLLLAAKFRCNCRQRGGLCRLWQQIHLVVPLRAQGRGPRVGSG